MRPPHPSHTLEIYDSLTVFVLDVERRNPKGSDFTLPSPIQNLVAITHDCELCWTVSRPPENPDRAESGYHRRLWKLGDRLVSKAGREPSRHHEIELSSGEIVRTWDKDEFGIADELLELDGAISQVQLTEDVYLIETAESLYGFDTEGNRLWRKPRDYRLRELDTPRPTNGDRWNLAQDFGSGDEQYVWAMKYQGRNPQRYNYRIDLRTGKFVEAQNGPSSWVET